MSYTGITKFFNSYAYLLNIDSNCWILESDATQYMTHNKTLLLNFKALPKSLMVNLPNSYKVR